MLPDFPLTKKILNKKFNSFLKEKVKAYSELPISDEQYNTLHEGDGMLIHYSDDKSHDTPLQNIGDGNSMSIDALLKDPPLIFTKLDELAKKIAEKQGKMLFDTISEVTDKFGQSSKRPSEPTGETILEMLEGIQFSFNEDGTHQMPTFYCAPNMVEKVQKAGEEVFNNPQLKQKYIQILNTKKQEWLDRTNNRKLVD